MNRLVETPAGLVYTLQDPRETDTWEIAVEMVTVIASAGDAYPAVGNLPIDSPEVVAERAVLRSVKTKNLYCVSLFAVYLAPYQAVFSLRDFSRANLENVEMIQTDQPCVLQIHNECKHLSLHPTHCHNADISWCTFLCVTMTSTNFS